MLRVDGLFFYLKIYPGGDDCKKKIITIILASKKIRSSDGQVAYCNFYYCLLLRSLFAVAIVCYSYVIFCAVTVLCCWLLLILFAGTGYYDY